MQHLDGIVQLHPPHERLTNRPPTEHLQPKRQPLDSLDIITNILILLLPDPSSRRKRRPHHPGRLALILRTPVEEPTQHHHAVARLQLWLHGERLAGEHVVIPQMAAGDEARGAVGAVGGCVGDEETHASVSAEGVGFRGGLPVVIDDVVAVEALRASPRANDEALGVVQLGLGDAGDDLVAVLDAENGRGLVRVACLGRRWKLGSSRGIHPVIFQCAGEEILSHSLPYRMADEVESVSFRFA